MSAPRVTVAVLPGDGIGASILDGPMQILEWLGRRGVIAVSGPWEIGATAFARGGELLPQDTVDACAEADYILLGAVGEHPGIEVSRPERALLALRDRFELGINVRHILRPEGPPLAIVRNLLGGAYGSDRREAGVEASAADVIELDLRRISQVAEVAVAQVQSHGGALISVDKANLFATSRLWRAVVSDVAARHDMSVRHLYVDQAAYQLARNALPHAAIVTEGIFGDILSDLACGRAGSIALCSSASITTRQSREQRGPFGLYEPAHGSAPRHVGEDRANPTGAFLALAALLRADANLRPWGDALYEGAREALRQGPCTYDLSSGAPAASTSEFTECVVSCFLNRVGTQHESQDHA